MANIVVSALATFNGKALKKGQKDISAFDKQAQKLGRTFTRVFAATALVAFSKKAISAFAADEKAAKSLAVQLENTGNAFRVNEVEAYIGGLQQLYGVLDDQLRPAFQTLLNATGSVTLSQQALETALNVSAGTGKDLGSVVAAIAKGAAGTTTAITRLGTGLDKATIATGDMNKIMAALDEKFKGQALARLETYAGKMDLLKVAAADATEIIGKGLVDALSAFGKDNSINQASDSMNSFATSIANVTTGIGELAADIKKLVDSDIGKFLLTVAALIGLPKKILVAGAVGVIANDIGQNKKPSSNFQYGAGNPQADLLASKNLVKARKEEFKIIATKNAIENKNVEELKKKFDLERIGLTAALNSATDEETKLRLKAQLAILDNNEAMAKKLLAEMEAAEALKKLAEQARLAGMSIEEFGIFKVKTLSNKIDSYIEDMGISIIRELNARITAMLAKFNMTAPAASAQTFTGASGASYTAPQVQAAILDTRELNTRIGDFLAGFATQKTQQSSNLTAPEMRLTIDAGGDRMSQAIAESIQVATRSGYSTVPAGFL